MGAPCLPAPCLLQADREARDAEAALRRLGLQ